MQMRKRKGLRPRFDLLACAIVLTVSTSTLYACFPTLDSDGWNACKMHYLPYLPILLMIWLWSVNLSVFHAKGIDYRVAFHVSDPGVLPSASSIRGVATLLTTATMFSLASQVYCRTKGWEQAANYQPALLLFFLFCMLTFPNVSKKTGARMFFATTMRKCLFPLQSVDFPEFFLADIFTSLAKPVSDLERSMCHVFLDPVVEVHGASVLCGSKSWLLTWWLFYPYGIRFVQCIWIYIEHRERGQLFNALKYATAFPVIFLSQLKYHVSEENWVMWCHSAWLFSALLNSIYSFYWDIDRDWELGFVASRGTITQHSLQFGKRNIYYIAIVTNAILRTSWTYKLSTHLRHHQMTNLVISSLEVFRRFQWIFFRLETEWRRISTGERKDHPKSKLEGVSTP